MADFLNYRHYKAQDFVWDDTFRSWVLDAKPEDTLYWTEFMVRFPDKEAEINLAREMILQMRVEEPDISESQINRITEAVLLQTETSLITPPETSRKRWKVPALVGMTVLAFSIVTALIYTVQTQSENAHQLTYSPFKNEKGSVDDEKEPLIEKTNFSGQPMKIVLADQSEIVLENESSIRYSSSFATDGFREIHLSGHAFFEVAKDAKRPFVVYANGIATKVLGTSFRIHAPENKEQRPTVEVVSGIVAVYPVGDKKPQEVVTQTKIGEVILTRNQKVEYSKAQNSLVTGLVDDPIPVLSAPKNQQFTNHPILRILETLKSDYGIDIIHDDHLLVNRTLTADLSGLTMYQKLDVICRAINARYETIDGKIIIL